MSPTTAHRIMRHLPGWLWRRLPLRLQRYVVDAWLQQYASVRRLVEP